MDVNVIKDRALMLGIDREFIDDNDYFSVQDGLLVFHLNNYVKKTKEITINIPEGVDVVYLDLQSNVYEDKARYKFVFPSSCIGVYGGQATWDKNVINIVYSDVYGRSSKFENSTFDFRKCKGLTKVYNSSFMHMSINKLLFAKEMTEFKDSVFSRSMINRLEAPGVVKLGRSCFSSTIVKQLKLGDSLCYFDDGSLSFNALGYSKKEAVFGDISHVGEKAIEGIDSVYMEYDYRRGITELREELLYLVNRMETQNVTVANIISEIIQFKNLNLNYDLKGLGILNSIENKIYQYHINSEKVQRESSKSMILSLVRKFYRFSGLESFKYKFYLYKKGGDLDVHDRNYTYLIGDEQLDIYLEED